MKPLQFYFTNTKTENFMGLFSWLKKTGNSASNKAGEAANTAKEVANEAANAAYEARLADQKKVMLTGLVDSLGVGVQNFDLEYHNGTATVYGQVNSDANKNMIHTALSNADGITSVDNRISVVAPAMQTYVVKSGDSLSKIAKAHYGDPMKYKEIFAANTDILDDPNKIFPGQELKIPNL